MRYSALAHFLEEKGFRYESLTKQAKWTFQQRWRECFAAKVRGQTGRWSTKDVADWEALAAGFGVCVTGTEADVLYGKLGVNDFTMISSNDQIASYCCEAQKPPNLENLLEFLTANPYVFDLYVSACDVDWTFVLTHESGFERFFAVREWQHDPVHEREAQ